MERLAEEEEQRAMCGGLEGGAVGGRWQGEEVERLAEEEEQRARCGILDGGRGEAEESDVEVVMLRMRGVSL